MAVLPKATVVLDSVKMADIQVYDCRKMAAKAAGPTAVLVARSVATAATAASAAGVAADSLLLPLALP